MRYCENRAKLVKCGYVKPRDAW